MRPRFMLRDVLSGALVVRLWPRVRAVEAEEDEEEEPVVELFHAGPGAAEGLPDLRPDGDRDRVAGRAARERAEAADEEVVDGAVRGRDDERALRADLRVVVVVPATVVELPDGFVEWCVPGAAVRDRVRTRPGVVRGRANFLRGVVLPASAVSTTNSSAGSGSAKCTDFFRLLPLLVWLLPLLLWLPSRPLPCADGFEPWPCLDASFLAALASEAHGFAFSSACLRMLTTSGADTCAAGFSALLLLLLERLLAPDATCFASCTRADSASRVARRSWSCKASICSCRASHDEHVWACARVAAAAVAVASLARCFATESAFRAWSREDSRSCTEACSVATSFSNCRSVVATVTTRAHRHGTTGQSRRDHAAECNEHTQGSPPPPPHTHTKAQACQCTPFGLSTSTALPPSPWPSFHPATLPRSAAGCGGDG